MTQGPDLGMAGGGGSCSGGMLLQQGGSLSPGSGQRCLRAGSMDRHLLSACSGVEGRAMGRQQPRGEPEVVTQGFSVPTDMGQCFSAGCVPLSLALAQPGEELWKEKRRLILFGSFISHIPSPRW